ncbi:hypothetical protein [Haloarcula argentinensis]|nr:hypothetical protein [Haloarcula argentinensis]
MKSGTILAWSPRKKAYFYEEYDAEEGVYINGSGPMEPSTSADAETNDV